MGSKKTFFTNITMILGVLVCVVRALVDDLVPLLNLLKNEGVGWLLQSVGSPQSWGRTSVCFWRARICNCAKCCRRTKGKALDS